MLLERKNAIIYGGGGAIGSAVARALPAAGARIYLACRTGVGLQPSKPRKLVNRARRRVSQAPRN
jgi:NAD(P)-dependent dehydrogenase (short-subunit alcohol dehydrogenase family)